MWMTWGLISKNVANNSYFITGLLWTQKIKQIVEDDSIGLCKELGDSIYLIQSYSENKVLVTMRQFLLLIKESWKQIQKSCIYFSELSHARAYAQVLECHRPFCWTVLAVSGPLLPRPQSPSPAILQAWQGGQHSQGPTSSLFGWSPYGLRSYEYELSLTMPFGLWDREQTLDVFSLLE